MIALMVCFEFDAQAKGVFAQIRARGTFGDWNFEQKHLRVSRGEVCGRPLVLARRQLEPTPTFTAETFGISAEQAVYVTTFVHGVHGVAKVKEPKRRFRLIAAGTKVDGFPNTVLLKPQSEWKDTDALLAANQTLGTFFRHLDVVRAEQTLAAARPLHAKPYVPQRVRYHYLSER